MKLANAWCVFCILAPLAQSQTTDPWELATITQLKSVRTFALSEDGSKAIVAGASSDGTSLGLVRSTDGMDSWTQITDSNLPVATITNLEMTPDGTKVIASISKKLYLSTDGGVTWAEKNFSTCYRRFPELHLSELQTTCITGVIKDIAISDDGATQAVATDTGGVHSRALVSTDSGGSWTEHRAGLHRLDSAGINSIAINGNCSSGAPADCVLMCAIMRYQVYIADLQQLQRRGWARIPDIQEHSAGFWGPNMLAFTPDGSQRAVAQQSYLATTPTLGGLWSSDRPGFYANGQRKGVIWTQVKDDVTLANGLVTDHVDYMGISMTADGEARLAGAYKSYGLYGGLYKSCNAGGNWTTNTSQFGTAVSKGFTLVAVSRDGSKAMAIADATKLYVLKSPLCPKPSPPPPALPPPASPLPSPPPAADNAPPPSSSSASAPPPSSDTPSSVTPSPPPPTPAPNAEVFKVTTAFILSGTVEQYNEAAKESIKAVIAKGAGVLTSAVKLILTAGSVLVTAEIFVASEAAAETATSDLTTGILKDSTSLETAITTQFKKDGVPADSVTVQEITAAPAAIVPAASGMLVLYVGVPVLLVLVGIGVGLALWKKSNSKGVKVVDGAA